MQTQHSIEATEAPVFNVTDLPTLNLSQINNLTDETGIIQHAIFEMPNRKEGYCIDDNSRALLFTVLASKSSQAKTVQKLMQVYLSFIHYMQTDHGEFRNFMSYSKVCHEERGSEDSFGRTVMALGFLVNEAPSRSLITIGAGIFNQAYPNIRKLTSIRGIANSMVGVCQFIKYNYPDDIKLKLVIELADKMTLMYKLNKAVGWHWYEPKLTYDNAILPLALLNAYEISNDEKYFEIAFESMEFLESKVFKKNMLHPIGNDGWLSRGQKKGAQFDQQGIDTMAMILFYQQAFRITQSYKFKRRMYHCYKWFLGNNDLGLPLYDPLTGGCADGLHKEGINLNQGAESTLAYWISHMIVASSLV